MLACRMCFGPTRTMLSLTPTPLANSFLSYPNLDAERYPLDVTQCIVCDHVQLGDCPDVDWVDYRYSTPEAVRPHLEEAARVLRRTYPKAKTVLEIGCNNGLYLDVLNKAGFAAVGVDPCTTVGIAKPFTHALARAMEPVDLIVANNVLAHVEDLWDVFRGIDHLLGEDGALVFEVQSFTSLMDAGAFDMIYHEHRDYHTLSPWPRFLKRFGLIASRIEDIPTHGGSLRIHCQRPGIFYYGTDSYSLDWRRFKHRIAEEKSSLLAQIAEVDGPLVAFGATAKSCTLIHHFGLADLIDRCLDSTPAKWGRFIPGTRIQIHAPNTLDGYPDATILLTAWNFEKEIRAQFPQHHFIVPFSKEVPCPV